MCPSPPCDNYGSFDHKTLSCHVESLFAQFSSNQVAYINNFQPRLNNNSYSNTFNPSGKNHPKLSYRSKPLPISQANARPSPPNFQRPNFPSQALQNSNLEATMKSILLMQKKQNGYIK